MGAPQGRENAKRVSLREVMKVTNMQNAHLNCYSDKVLPLAMPISEAARCFAASAVKPTNNYTRIPRPFDLRIISIMLQKTISVIIAGLSLLCPHARGRRVASRAVLPGACYFY